MSQPIVIPPVQTPEERFRMAMRDPAVRRRAANDPLYAARLREALTPGPNFSMRPNIDPRSAQTFARPTVSTTFSGFGVAPVGVSVADQVRMQRDAFLVADGSQVTGNYDTAIRAAKGGIPAPRTPPVGSPSAFYPYPGNNMRTGAALAGNGVVATETRGLLPTTGFNASAFVATRPDSLNRTLATNVPVPMPRYRIPASTTSIVTSSPSEERRRNISTLMGLGAANTRPFDPRQGGKVDEYTLLMEFLNNDAAFKKFGKKYADALSTFFGWFVELDEDLMTENEKKQFGISEESTTLEKVKFTLWEALKTAVRLPIRNLILAKTIDFNTAGIKETITALDPSITNPNKTFSDAILKYFPKRAKSIIDLFGGLFPLNIEITGVRKYLLRFLYRKIWNVEMPAEVYRAVSSKLACQSELLGASMSTAIDLMMDPAYGPDKKPTVVKCAAADAWDEKEGISAETGGELPPAEEAEGEVNMTIVKGGLIAAAVLIGVGLYAKTR